MDTAINYITPHSAFRLNGEYFSFEAIKSLAYSFVKEGNENEQHLGQFILNWTDNTSQIYLQTSGTTSKPTTISISKQSFINSANATGIFFNLKPNDSALCCLPFAYIAAKMMFVRAWILGLNLDYIEPTSNPLESISIDYDFSAMVPLQLKNSLTKINQIKTLLVGGAPVSERFKNELIGCQSSIYETFGMTETVSHIAVKNLSLGDTIFKTLPGISLGVNNNNCLTIKAPKLTPEVLNTKDVVELISKYEFIWKGRLDHVINSGGLKIFPEELEQQLEPQIKNRFFVASLPDEHLGQKVILVVEGTPQDLNLKWDEIDSKKRPKQIFFIPQFLETKSGKIKRKTTLGQLDLDHS
ncbi:MAG: AMP-binding protein [Flavobacteriaceae bacterium]